MFLLFARTAATVCVGAADAGFTPFLFSVDVPYGGAQNQGDDSDKDDSFHSLFPSGFVCFLDENYNESDDGQYDQKTGNKAAAETAGGDESANLVDEEA